MQMHPNSLIPKVHWARSSKFYHLLVMELYHGGTLESYINDPNNTRETRLKNLPALARSLAACLCMNKHFRLVHNDLKPANIMFRDSDQCFSKIILVDFGLAGEPRYAADSFRGTFGHAAPEKLMDQEYERDWKVDVYSMGVCLCYFVIGDVILSHCQFITREVNLNDVQVLLHQMGVSDALNRLIISMIQSNPSLRPCPELILYDAALSNATNPLEKFKEDETCTLVNAKAQVYHMNSVVEQQRYIIAKQKRELEAKDCRLAECEASVAKLEESIYAARW